MSYYPAPPGAAVGYQQLPSAPQAYYAQPQPVYTQPVYVGANVPSAAVVLVPGGGSAGASPVAAARRLFIASTFMQLITLVFLAASLGTSWLVVTLSVQSTSTSYSMDLFNNVRICTSTSSGGPSSCSSDSVSNLGNNDYGFAGVPSLMSGSRAAASLCIVAMIIAAFALLHSIALLRSLTASVDSNSVAPWLATLTQWWRHPSRRMAVVAFEAILAVALYSSMGANPFLSANDIPQSIPAFNASSSYVMGPGFGLAAACIGTSIVAAMLSGCAIANVRTAFAQQTRQASWIVSMMA